MGLPSRVDDYCPLGFTGNMIISVRVKAGGGLFHMMGVETCFNHSCFVKPSLVRSSHFFFFFIQIRSII